MYKCLLALIAMLAAGYRAVEPPSPGQDLTSSSAFFLPEHLTARATKRPLVRGKDLNLSVEDHLRYLGARAGTSFVEEHVLALLAARECAARGLAKDAVALARKAAGKAAREGHAGHDHHGVEDSVREASMILLRLRMDALVRADRRPTEKDLRRLFDHEYGVDGHKVEVRHVLVAFPATERRLAAAGKATDEATIDRTARLRAEELHAKLRSGTPLSSLLEDSDDPTTRSLLVDPRFKSRAGFLEGYNYQRYGVPFADAVRKLAVGSVSAPVRTSHGYHLLELVSRKTTRFADVAQPLRERYLAQPSSTAEQLALQKALFKKYESASVSDEPQRSPQLLVLTGATASGKTEIALRVAEAHGLEILSADSMSVYRRMDIGTAKPTPAERARVAHWGIDLVEPSADYDSARFVAEADRVIAAVTARGKGVLVVGGTPLYLMALLRGFFDGPRANPELRARLGAREDEQPGSLHAELSRIDAVAAARIHSNDRRRLVRALEVWELCGKPISELQQQFEQGPPRYGYRAVRLSLARATLQARVRTRTTTMLARGLVDEVRAIQLERGFSQTAGAAIGYHETLRFLDGQLSAEELPYRIRSSTHRLVRRQDTWFRRFPDLQPIVIDGQDSAAASRTVEASLFAESHS